MCITAKILKHVFGVFNGLLDIDDPFFGIKGFFELLELVWIFKRSKFQPFVPVGFGHKVEKFTPENFRHRFDIKQIGLFGGVPGTIGFQYAAGDQAMKMKMRIELLIPSV